jgi:hypothetical protein
MPNLQYPTLITWTDPSGKTHIPPDPPLIEGYPPWWPRPNEYRRNEPLKKCPALQCRRARRCAAPHYGKFCQKTHMEREEFRWQLDAKISALMTLHNIPSSKPSDDAISAPPPEMKRALQERQDELIHTEILKYQTQWIEKQKQKWAKKHQPSINSVENCPSLTTR